MIAGPILSLLLAVDSWSGANTALELTFATEVVVDAMQTRYALDNTKFVETNPILGKHPSPAKIYGLSAAGIVGHAAIAYILPKGFREMWQIVFLVPEAVNVAGNYTLIGGLKLSF